MGVCTESNLSGRVDVIYDQQQKVARIVRKNRAQNKVFKQNRESNGETLF
jgi:hypothetical protein